MVQDLPAQASTPEATAYTIGLSASDPDGDALTYFANHLPPGAIFDPLTNQLDWRPGAAYAAAYPNLLLGVDDGSDCHQELHAASHAGERPVLTPVPDRTVRAGDPIRIQLHASDPESDPLTFSSPLLPPGAFLDPNTGVFQWTPSFTEPGVYTVPFHVSDGTNDTVSNTTFTVLDAPAAPVFDQLGPYTTLENQAMSFRAFAFDPHNPGFVPQDRLSDGTLTQNDDGTYALRYEVRRASCRARLEDVV